MNLPEFKLLIRNYLFESLSFVEEQVDYDNIKFLPEHDIDFNHPETNTKCSTFKVAELHNIRGWAGKKRYLESCLPKLGQGSSRIVFLLEPTKAIKLARNDKGLAQNEREADLQHAAKENEDVMAQILDYDQEKYLWVEMEIARKLDAQSFKRITGLPWAVFRSFMMSDRMRYTINKPMQFGGKEFTADDFYENEFVSSLTYAADNYGIMRADLESPRQYGIVNRNGKDFVVLVDYGLNQQIWSQHYDRNRNRFN